MPTGRRRGKNPTTKRTARTRQKSQETLGKFAKAYPEMINRENWWFTHGRRELARIIENLKHLESIRKSAGQAVKEGAKDAEIKKKAILSASLAQRTITEARQLLKIGQRRLRDFDLLIETQITLPKETELERELFRNELKQISEAIEIAKGDLEGALIAIEQIEKRNMRLKKGN